jgi:Arm DNA-binding domain/Domain of unknown function (DUF927)
MSVERITKRVVDAAKAATATYLVRDSQLKGFVLVVTPYGGKSYAIDYRAGRGRRARKRRLTIGKHGSPWTPDTARQEATKLLGLIASGADPLDNRNRGKAALTVAELCELYLREGTVAKIAKDSSRLRLMIGAAFAAPLLRPLGMDSFALNLFGTTSTGKTSGGLYAAGSVAGLFGENRLPGWSDSIAALEQLAVGHRDGVLPLDDTGDEGGGPLPIHKKAKYLAFMFGRNRGRNLDKSYEKNRNSQLKSFESSR